MDSVLVGQMAIRIEDLYSFIFFEQNRAARDLTAPHDILAIWSVLAETEFPDGSDLIEGLKNIFA